MHQLSYDEEESFPVGTKIVPRDFYVDNLISGGDSVAEVVDLCCQVKNLCREATFQSVYDVRMIQQPWKESLTATHCQRQFFTS